MLILNVKVVPNDILKVGGERDRMIKYQIPSLSIILCMYVLVSVVYMNHLHPFSAKYFKPCLQQYTCNEYKARFLHMHVYIFNL